MNSQQRREIRYQRRKASREQKKSERSANIGALGHIMAYSELFKAGKRCCSGVRWKQSTQSFERHLFSKTAEARRRLLTGTWKPGRYSHFMLNERGKSRPIDAPPIQDRQVHKVFTKRVLLPLYLPDMIWNNGASLEGKGFDFSRKMLTQDLHRFYRKYGLSGSVILLDFKQFFPSAPHKALLERHRTLIQNEELRSLGDSIVKSNGRSYGMPLGVEPSQAEMIALPSPLDNYIKSQLGMKYAGHYMDDYYMFVPPNVDAKAVLKRVTSKAESIGLTISWSKTRIQPICKPFKYCKIKYTLLPSGKVIATGNRGGIKRARRKIKSFQEKIANGSMTYEDLWTSVNGILAYFEKYNDHNRVLKLRRLFYKIYGFSPERIAAFRAAESKREEQMEYITYKRFKGKAICGEVNIPAMTKLDAAGGMIYYNGKPLCVVASSNAHKHFARNDDGQGVLRGQLITKITRSLEKKDANYQTRWDAVWEDPVCNQYRRIEHEDHWLWNHAFYNASIDRLEYILSVVEKAK